MEDLLTLDSPCDSCENYDRCKDDLLACTRYFMFVETGLLHKGNTEPNFWLYDCLFEQYSIVRNQFSDQAAHNALLDVYNHSTGEDFLPGLLKVTSKWDVTWAVHNRRNEVIGGVAYEELKNARHIQYLYIKDTYKGCGIGSRLLGVAEAGAKSLLLSPSPLSMEFYKKRGYIPVPGTKEQVFRKKSKEQLQKSSPI